MKNVRIRLNRALSRLGAPGLIGVGLLLFSAGLYASWIVPTRNEIAAMKGRAVTQQQRSGAQPVGQGRQEPLGDFYGFFPPVDTGTDWLGRVYALAERQDLDLLKGEYRLTSTAQDKIRSYQVIFPLKGSYQQVRGFIVSLLNEVPFASLDDLRLEKQRTADSALDAQVKLTFFFRSQ